MKTIKFFLSRLFASNYTYNDAYTVRVHKETGKVEYLNFDDWGSFWLPTPMFADTPLWGGAQ
jgi:hypothetical protein